MLVLLMSRDALQRMYWQGIWAENVSKADLTTAAEDDCRKNKRQFVQLLQPRVEGATEILCNRLHQKFAQSFLMACASAFQVGCDQAAGKRPGKGIKKENAHVLKIIKDPQGEEFLQVMHSQGWELGTALRD